MRMQHICAEFSILASNSRRTPSCSALLGCYGGADARAAALTGRILRWPFPSRTPLGWHGAGLSLHIYNHQQQGRQTRVVPLRTEVAEPASSISDETARSGGHQNLNELYKVLRH